MNIKRLVAIMVPVIAAAAFVALPASAAPPAPPTTCTSAIDNLDTPGGLIVPAGATCALGFPKVGGNVTVLGTLSAYGYSFGKNVTVLGGTIALANGGSIADNLTITGSRGTTALGTPNAGSFHKIGGDLTYSGNANGIGDGLFIDHAKVAGSITVAFNSGHYWYNLFNSTAGQNITVAYNKTAGGPIQLSNNTAGKYLTCTGNSPAPRIPSWGSANTAVKSVLGQCAGLLPSYMPNEVVATGTIDSSELEGTTTALLTSGNYRIDVSGTYTNRDLNVADAEYTTVDGWTTHQQGYYVAPFLLGENFGDVQVDGEFVDWGAHSTQHAYSLTMPLSGEVNLAVFDGDTTKDAAWYGDNSGSLNYTITYVGPQN